MITRLLVLLLIAACAHKESDNSLTTVDFNDDSEKRSIEISKKDNTDYGPVAPESVVAEQSKDISNIVVAVDLYPALYNSLGYVSTFAELERNKINVSIISSSGFSSVIAALYAKYSASNMVEWKAFELYQVLGDKKPFDDDWKRDLQRFLKKEFGDKKLSQLSKVLVIPQMIRGKPIANLNRMVVTALMDAVNLDDKRNPMTSSNQNYLGMLKSFGADKIFRISFLPEKISLKHADGFIFGVYSKLASISSRGFFYKEALEGDIDAFTNLSDSVYQTKDENEQFASEILSILEANTGKN